MLLALATGMPSSAHVDALVAAVLSEAPEVIRLALAVRDGGEDAARRAIELAALVAAARERDGSPEKPE